MPTCTPWSFNQNGCVFLSGCLMNIPLMLIDRFTALRHHLGVDTDELFLIPPFVALSVIVIHHYCSKGRTTAAATQQFWDQFDQNEFNELRHHDINSPLSSNQERLLQRIVQYLRHKTTVAMIDSEQPVKSLAVWSAREKELFVVADRFAKNARLHRLFGHTTTEQTTTVQIISIVNERLQSKNTATVNEKSTDTTALLARPLL